MIAYIVYFLICFVLYAAFVKQGFHTFAQDPGIGWHLKTGEYITINGQVPNIDPHLSIARPWISDQWLSDFLLFWMQNNLGWELSYALLLGIYFIPYLVFLNFPSKKATALGASLAIFLCARVSAVHFIFRPVLFSFFLFALLYFLLLNTVKKADVDKKLFVILPLVFLLWANIHPSFFLGLFLIFMLMIVVTVCKFVKQEEQYQLDSSYINKLLLLLILCGLATLINPYFLELHKSIFALGQSEFFMTLNVEWQPLQLNSSEGQLVTFICAIIIYWFFALQRQSLKIYFSLFCAVFFLYQTLVSVRFLPYFSLCVMPLLVTACSDIHKSYFKVLTAGFRGREKILFFLFFAFVLTFVGVSKKIPFVDSSVQYGIPEIQKFINPIQQFSNGQTQIIYNHPNLGGKLTYFCGKSCKPVLDDRNTLIGEGPYQEFISIKTWDDLLMVTDKYQASFALLRNKRLPMTDAPSQAVNSFEKVLSTDDYTLFRRIS